MRLLTKRRRSGLHVVSTFTHPDIDRLLDLEAQEWVQRSRQLKGLTAGLGFAGVPLPNTEPVVAPTAVTGVTAETNLYTPGTGANAEWALLPQGVLRSPQAWAILAGGIYTSSSTSQTAAFTSRLGTSGTPATNQSLGATGVISLGNATAITNGLWFYNGLMTIRGPGTSATAVCHASVDVSNQAAGSIVDTHTGMSGNTTATFDATQQQGFVISVTPSAAGVSIQLTQLVLLALD